MKIGFTGTQRGMTDIQRDMVGALLLGHNEEDEFHHGDCVGADAQVHDLVMRDTLMKIHIHPPTNSNKRAFKKCAKVVYDPLPYLERNKVIVNETDVLIAAPSESIEQLRSGTWSTVRYARSINRKIVIVYPDGIVRGRFYGIVRSEI